MKAIVAVVLFLVPGLLSAQTWANCASPCTISAQISGGQLSLVDPSQAYVQVNLGTQITWTVTGANYFIIALDYNTVIFGPGSAPFFFSSSSSGTGGTVTTAGSSAGSHYFIYAIDSTGKKYVLDPKVRTNSGLHHPTRSKK